MSDYETQMRTHEQWRRAIRHGSRKIKVAARRARALVPVEAVAAVQAARKS